MYLSPPPTIVIVFKTRSISQWGWSKSDKAQVSSTGEKKTRIKNEFKIILVVCLFSPQFPSIRRVNMIPCNMNLGADTLQSQSQMKFLIQQSAPNSPLYVLFDYAGCVGGWGSSLAAELPLPRAVVHLSIFQLLPWIYGSPTSKKESPHLSHLPSKTNCLKKNWYLNSDHTSAENLSL